MQIKKAIIPAAGLGTRMLPATKALPKEMLPIYDKPTLQYIIEEAVDAGIEEILIITGRNKHSIEDHFDRSIELELALEEADQEELLKEVKRISSICDIHYIRQKKALGLGHAIYCARAFIRDEPFAVLLGDDIVYSKTPCIKQLMDIYEKKGHSVLGVQEVPKDQVSKYGIVQGDKVDEGLYLVNELIEKPSIQEAPSNIAILGRYIITSDIFEILKNTKKGKNNEIQLTDALNELAKKQEMHAYVFEGQRYDIGDKLGMLKASVEFSLRDDEYRDKILEYLGNITKENQ